MWTFGWIIIGLLSISSSVLSDRTAASFAKDYFPSHIVQQIVAFGCWDVQDAVKFSRYLNNHNIKVAYLPIRERYDMDRILKVNYYRLGIFMDFDCERSEIIFDQYMEHRIRYNESYWWLMTSAKKSVPEDFLSELPLNIATEMTFALRQNESYDLYDVYNPSYKHGAKLNVTFMGTWDIEDGLDIIVDQYKYLRRGNLHGLTLNSSIVLHHSPENDFMTYLRIPTDPSLDSMHRYNYGLIVQLSDYYNFTLHIKRDSSWGYLLPNGSYNGILGDMAKGVVDISLTPFQFKKDRLDVVEYTVQTWMAMIRLIFRHPQKNDLKNVFLKPFEPVVWYYITLVALVNWLLLFLTAKIEQHYDWRPPVNSLDTNPATEIGLIAVAAVCQQGLSDGPRIFSGRILFLFLFLWALLMYQFYSASVVGSLLVEEPRYITTAQDVLDSNLAIGAEDIPYNYDFFETTDSPAIKGIFNTKMAPDKKTMKRPFFTAEEGLKKMKNGGFGFHVDIATAYKIIEETFEENEICELQEIHLFEPKHCAVGVARHSPFKKMVTYGMRKVMEHGTPKRLRSIWAHRRPECPESHSSSPVPVEIEEFSPALFLLMFGFGVSLFIMFLEHVAIRYEKRRIGKNQDHLGSEEITKGTTRSTPSEISYPNDLS